MSIRKDALRWLKTNVGVSNSEEIFTSKYYGPAQSWTKKNAWWMQVPVNRVTSQYRSHIHLLCQTGPSENNFHYLRVPSDYLAARLSGLTVTDRKRINLFLSAEAGNLFQDERGPGGVEFGLFLIK